MNKRTQQEVLEAAAAHIENVGWCAKEVPGRGWYVRRDTPSPGPSATQVKVESIGPMSDMVAPDKLLTKEQAEAVAMAMNGPVVNGLALQKAVTWDEVDQLIIQAGLEP